jgi:hypothetical protein
MRDILLNKLNILSKRLDNIFNANDASLSINYEKIIIDTNLSMVKKEVLNYNQEITSFNLTFELKDHLYSGRIMIHSGGIYFAYNCIYFDSCLEEINTIDDLILIFHELEITTNNINKIYENSNKTKNGRL